jgi:hypothetical protein
MIPPMRRHALFLAVFPAAFAAAALLVQLHVGAYGTDRGQTADEAAHFVTSLMLSDYLRHPAAHPIAFAKDYYVHLPRVAIGHWPPFFEMLQALAFEIFGGTNSTALAFQAIVAGLLAGLPAALMARYLGAVAGLLTGILILCSRYVLFQIDTDMADNLLALLVFLAAWAWSRYCRRPSWRTAAAFAAAAAAAILTKGTAIGLLLLPPAHAAVTRNWRLLIGRRGLAAFAAILLATAPWYLFTYRMAANGWNYSWGSFTLLAAPFFAGTFLSEFGVPATLGFLFGAWRALRRPQAGPPDIGVFAVTAMVQFVFILLVPADLEPRYLVPVYPCAAIVAVWGLFGLIDMVLPASARRFRNRDLVSGAVAALLVMVSVWQGFRPAHVESFRTREAFAALATARNPLILISGSSRFEGAMISTVAQADHGRSLYALRASKLLSSSSFMGNGYRPRFDRPAQMKAWLLRNRIGWIVIDTSADSMRYSHNRMLFSLLLADPKDFRVQWWGMRKDGATAVFSTPASGVRPTHDREILAEQAPSGVP